MLGMAEQESEERPMTEASVGRVDRTTAVLDPLREATLRCAHCGASLTDDDAECPKCESPIDWGASDVALRAWRVRTTER